MLGDGFEGKSVLNTVGYTCKQEEIDYFAYENWSFVEIILFTWILLSALPAVHGVKS
jgi:hypothetical protein